VEVSPRLKAWADAATSSEAEDDDDIPMATGIFAVVRKTHLFFRCHFKLKKMINCFTKTGSGQTL
jgi:hypothetical protein